MKVALIRYLNRSRRKIMNKNSIAFALIAISLFWMMSNDAKNREELEKETEAKKATELTTAPGLEGTVAAGVPGKAQVADSYNPPTISVNPDDSTIIDTVLAPKISEQTVKIATDKFDVILTNKGAKVKSIVMHHLSNDAGEFPELIQEDSLGMLGLEIDEKDFSQVLFEVQGGGQPEITINKETSVVFTWQDAQGRQIKRTFTFTKGADTFTQSVVFENFQPNELRYSWSGGMSETEDISQIGTFGSNYYFSEVVYSTGEEVFRETTDESEKFNEEKEPIEWLGLRRRYAAVLFEFDETIKTRIQTNPISQPEENPAPITYDISWDAKIESAKSSFVVRVQPLLYSDLKALGGSQEEILFSGWTIVGADWWFVGICGMILSFLNVLYGFIGNYGIAIMLLTFLVKLATMPLTINQIKSMRAMTAHKPALEALRKKYSKDPSRYQKEMMGYYKSKGINPLAPVMGCLPMILQMPIFIGLFVVLGRAVELRGQPFFAWITDLSQPDIIYAGFQIPLVMPHGISLLPPIMAATMYFQMKQSMSSADPIAKNMIFVMPVMMFLFSAVMPSGLVIYWIVSNLFTIFQYRFTGASNTPAAIPDGVKEATVVKSKSKSKKKK